jgi:hypothetical protein
MNGPHPDFMKTTFSTAALFTLICAGPAPAQLSEAAGMRANIPLEIGRFDLNIGGTLHRLGTSVGPRTPFSFESTLKLPRGASGFWLGSRLEGAPEVDSMPVRPLLGAGLWTTLRRVTISIGSATHAARIGGRGPQEHFTTGTYNAWTDTAPPTRIQISPDSSTIIRHGYYRTRDTTLAWTDSGAPSRATFWSDVEGRMGWTLGLASMEAVVGARPRIAQYDAKVWTRFGATYPVNDRLSISAFAGTDPGHIGIGVPSSIFASVALRVRPWRRTAGSGRDLLPAVAFNAQREPSGYRVTYLVAQAKTVELSGDFDRWRPVAMKQTRDGVWEVLLPIAPGTYRVNVRIDGGRWLPPAGLPQAEDDFNGAVGVLVIR